MKDKDLLKLILNNGFELKSIKGSHHKLFNPKSNITVVVPVHNKEIGVGLEHKILKQAGLK